MGGRGGGVAHVIVSFTIYFYSKEHNIFLEIFHFECILMKIGFRYILNNFHDRSFREYATTIYMCVCACVCVCARVCVCVCVCVVVVVVVVDAGGFLYICTTFCL